SCGAAQATARSPTRSTGSGANVPTATRSCARPRHATCPRSRCRTSAGRGTPRGWGTRSSRTRRQRSRTRPPGRRARRVAQLEDAKVTPDALTISGVGLCIAGSVAVFFEYVGWGFYWLGAALFVVGSVLDVLDGALARSRGIGSQFGAFLDSTVDRVGEG